MKNRFSAALLSAAMLMGQMLYLPSPAVTELTASADLEEGMGQIGDGVFWEYNNGSGTLTISGSGAIDELSQYPWTGETDPRFNLITIEEGVTNIPDGMFQGLSTVYEVEIADTVTAIGANAFANCSNLSGITLPNGLVTLSGTAFDGTNIRELNLPPALSSITDSYFSGCTSLARMSGTSTAYAADGNAMYTADFATLLWHRPMQGGDLSIRDGVTEIGTAVFENGMITNLMLPASLTMIGERAFNGCYPNTITFHGTQAQWDAVQIRGGNSVFETVTVTCTAVPEPEPEYLASGREGGVPWTLSFDGVLTIKPDPDNGKGIVPGYQYITLSSGFDYTDIYWTTAAPPWFKHQSEITSIVIEEGVQSIGKAAFTGLPFVTSISIPSTVYDIHQDAFAYCRRLETVTFPENSLLVNIGEDAFTYAESMRSFTIPETVETIGANAFDDCALETIHIPASVTEIGNCAFTECENLQSITVAADNSAYTSVDGALYSKDMTVLYQYPIPTENEIIFVPDTVREIAERAFADCSNVKNIWLPDGVTTIQDEAFEYCDHMTYIRLPSTLTYMGVSVFYGCNSLSSVVLPASLTECLSLSDAMYIADRVFYEGTQAQWAVISGLPAEPDYTVQYNARPSDYFSCDSDSDDSVDALEAARLLRYAAAEGSGYGKGFAHFLMSQGEAVAFVFNDTEADGSVPIDLNSDKQMDAQDAAVMLQYSAAVGSGYEDGLSAFLQQ